MTDSRFVAAAPRKLFIDQLESARMEVKSLVTISDYCPTLKLMISETEIRARNLGEDHPAYKGFMKRSGEITKKYGTERLRMKEYMEADEAAEWLIAIEEFYISIGLLEYEQEEQNWIEDELKEFYKKVER